jgi:PTH1 family peptidyl-tRNA hydrolase
MQKLIGKILKATGLTDGSPHTMVSKRYHLIAGLGNPGVNYDQTRHNIGFMVVDQLSKTYAIPLDHKKFKAVYGVGTIADVDVVLVKPMSYLNNSGFPLRQIANYFKISPVDMTIIHDDLDLGWESIKIKTSGGHGGHKGVRSIMETFGTGDFQRIRIGIGRSHDNIRVADYVLGRFSRGEQKYLETVLSKTIEVVNILLCEGPQVAMNVFHRKQ